MEFSSSSSGIEKNSSRKPIPSEIFQAVRVMGQGAGSVPDQSSPKPGFGTKAVSQSPSPFLSEGAPQPVKGVERAFQKGIPTYEKASVDKRVSSSSSQSRLKTSEKYKMIALALLAGLLLLGGLGYWYFSRKTATENDTVTLEQETPSVMMQSSSEPSLVALPFAPDTTNFLSFDTETINPDGLRQLFAEAGGKIVAANMTQPVEFLLTDKNNNPVAFSRFVYLMGLGLPEDLVAALGEKFSLFLYNDQGKAVIGLLFAPENMATTQSMVQEQESSLPFLFRSLLFGSTTVPKSATFRSGVYKDESVRYTNISETENLSFDYVMRSTEWIIGGSKNTLRAIVDKKTQ